MVTLVLVLTHRPWSMPAKNKKVVKAKTKATKPKAKTKAKVTKAKVIKAKVASETKALKDAALKKATAAKAKALKTEAAKKAKAKVALEKAKLLKANREKALAAAKIIKAAAKTTKAVKAKPKVTKKILKKAPPPRGEDGKKLGRPPKAAPVKPKTPVKAKVIKKSPPKKIIKPKPQVVRISPVLKPVSPKPKIMPSKMSAKKPCIQRSKIPLREHQIRVVEHVRKHRGLIVSHAVGSGKTLTAVTASQCYLDDHPKGEVIIVTPVTLQENIKKEMRGYGFDPDADPRYKFFTIQKFATTYNNKTCKNAMLIIDEAHELRTEIPGEKKKKFGLERESPQQKRARISRAGVAVKCAGTANKVLLLTATAVYNKPQDMANLVAMVKGIDPPGKTAFEKIMDDPAEFKNFFSCVMSFYDIPKDENYPTFEEHYEEIEMSPAYYKEYRAVELQNSHLFDDKNPWRFLTGVRQASNALSECMKCQSILKRAKEGKKMVIYSAFLSYGVNKIKELFDENGIKYVEVTGKMSKKSRDQSVKDYNANKVKIMFITKAGGQGLDLKGTRYIVIMESAWNRATEQQVFGRAARFRSHTHLPKSEQKVDAYHILIVKPPVGKSGRRVDDEWDSADTIIKEKMEDKDKIAIEFMERLYPLSIEQAKC